MAPWPIDPDSSPNRSHRLLKASSALTRGALLTQLHNFLIYLGCSVSFVSGVGLLIRRTGAPAVRLLCVTFLLWLLLFRLPNFLHDPLFEACWSVFPLAVMLAASWTLYCELAVEWDRRHLSLLNGDAGLRAARVIYGVSLIFFGFAHFIDLKDTLSLIPNWIPGHLFWAYFTGCAFAAGGIAQIIGICTPLAAVLSAVQIASFLLIVWVPVVAAGSTVPFQWSETIFNIALLAGGWVIAESYCDKRGTIVD